MPMKYYQSLFTAAMDDIDSPVRPRRPRAKDSFQMELQSKMRERKAKGLSADITSEESEGDGIDGLCMYFDRYRKILSSRAHTLSLLYSVHSR